MTSLQRISKIFQGLLMGFGAIILLIVPEHGYLVIGLILSVLLLVDGVRSLWFYFSMARSMVGGKLILYRGIIALDLGMFAYSLQEIPPVYIVLYLLVANLFAGVIDMLRAMEARRLWGHWRLIFLSGVINIVLALSCFLCFRNTALLSYLYAFGLFSSALIRITQAFHKTAIVYIP